MVWHKEGEHISVGRQTGFTTNAEKTAARLAKVCPGMHRHVPPVGGRAKASEVYPDGLCKALAKGPASRAKKGGRVREWHH